MYAIIKQGVDWREFENFQWRKKWLFNDEKEFDEVWDEMVLDVGLWKLIMGLSC